MYNIIIVYTCFIYVTATTVTVDISQKPPLHLSPEASSVRVTTAAMVRLYIYIYIYTDGVRATLYVFVVTAIELYADDGKTRRGTLRNKDI